MGMAGTEGTAAGEAPAMRVMAPAEAGPGGKRWARTGFQRFGPLAGGRTGMAAPRNSAERNTE